MSKLAYWLIGPHLFSFVHIGTVFYGQTWLRIIERDRKLSLIRAIDTRESSQVKGQTFFLFRDETEEEYFVPWDASPEEAQSIAEQVFEALASDNATRFILSLRGQDDKCYQPLLTYPQEITARTENTVSTDTPLHDVIEVGVDLDVEPAIPFDPKAKRVRKAKVLEATRPKPKELTTVSPSQWRILCEHENPKQTEAIRRQSDLALCLILTRRGFLEAISENRFSLTDAGRVVLAAGRELESQGGGTDA